MRAPILSAVFAVLFAAAPAGADEQVVSPWAKKVGLGVYATTFVGDGLRFNNPYRLATPLGSTAESVSRSASYADVGVAATVGDLTGIQHGLALRVAVALEGVRQAVVTPSYLVWHRGRLLGLYGRAGVPIVAGPETTVGLEVGAGGVLFVRGGVGLAAEIVGDVFYGAGTRDVATATYPMISAQLGIMIAYEVLPR